MDTASVSRKRLVLEVREKTAIPCDLKRHLSPRTVGIILRSLPLEGHAHLLGRDILYFESNIDSGMERSRTEFKRGDVAFLPSAKSLCFFLADTEYSKSMTIIGRLEGDVELLRQAKPGDSLRIYEDMA